MRFVSTLRFCLWAVIPLLFFSCKKTTEKIYNEPLSDYLPLQSGKYITYRIDSTVFTNFGRIMEIHSYQVKHVVDSQITDNLGRPSYRVFRYTRDTAGTQPWVPTGTYFITPLSADVELIEDNLRFIKLVLPIQQNYTWKGNANLPLNPYESLFNFSIDVGIQDWDFTYKNLDSTLSFAGNNYSNVWTIEEANDSINVPITNLSAYASKTRSVDKYAKNIGLVYREYVLWEYQPDPNGPSGYQVGFGIKMWMIDHN